MTRKQRWATLALIVGLTGGGIGGAALAAPAPNPLHLVHDFFPGEPEGDKPLPQLTKLGNSLFFVAADGETGLSVWRTDGTAAGSQQVPIPFAPATFDSAQILGTVGGRIVWAATATAHPDDGVCQLFGAGESGDAVALHACTTTSSIKILGQRLFFLSCAAGSGCGIWSTDGTAAGTALVPALTNPAGDLAVLDTLAGRWLIFSSGLSLVAYDVAQSKVLPLASSRHGFFTVYPAGQTLFIVRDGQVLASRLDRPGAALLYSGTFTVAGWKDGKLYFVGRHGRLWSTDGTPAGTHSYQGLQIDTYRMLADQLGPTGSTTLIPMPGYYGSGLLAADETRHEVTEVLPVCSGKYQCLGTSMSTLSLAGDHVFEAINGHLIRSDGTREGTFYGTGLARVDPGSFAVLDGRLLLGALRQGVMQLWETDGTAAGTRALSDGTREQPFTVQGPPIPFDGALYVAADRKPVGQQIWRVAGGQATAVTDLQHLATGISPVQAFAAGDRVLISGEAIGPWVSVAGDGSVEEVPDFSDACTLSSSTDPCLVPVTPVGGRLVYSPTYTTQLWSTDGTAAGTGAVLGLDGNPLETVAQGRLGDGALILSPTGALWASDGAPAGVASGGTRFIAQLPFNPAHPERFAPVYQPVAFGASTFLFRRAPGPQGPKTSVLEIWRTDGTAAGTLLLATTPFPVDYSTFLSPAVVGGRLFFRFGGTLWTSDGTAAGTYALPQQLPGGTFALAAGNGTLYAAAGYQDDDQNHQTLWEIDPTTLAATSLGTFGQVSTGGVGANLGSLLDDTLFFDVSDPQGIVTVWSTDGTAASTHPLPAPLASLTAKAFFTAGGRRFFNACEAEHGCELWSADRHGETASRVTDLWPGRRGSDPDILAVNDHFILFAATEPDTGRELWRLDLTTVPPPDADGSPPLSQPPRRSARRRADSPQTL